MATQKNKQTNKWTESFKPSGKLELFPTLTYHGQFDVKLLENIKSLLEDIREKDALRRSHVPIYDPAVYITDDQLHNRPGFKDLENALAQSMMQVANDQALSFQGVYCTGMWANISKNTYAHPEHSHPNSWMSGILYVKSPNGSAPTLFIDPRPARQVVQYNTVQDTRENGFQYVNAPTEGEIVIFPSWMKHSVPPSVEMSNDEERITLAFNYQLKFDPEQTTKKWTAQNARY